jgi:hypothetical protein
MSKDHGTPSGAFVNFLAALVKAAPRDLSDEVMQEWAERQGGELARRLRFILEASPRIPLLLLNRVDPQPVVPLHSNIRIPFKAGRHWYVAVGFLGPDEHSLDCDAILQRTASAGFGVYAEHCTEICEDLFIPRELWGKDLLSQWTIPGPPTSMVCFLSTDAENRRIFKQGWMNLDSQCRSNTLVLYRLLDSTD